MKQVLAAYETLGKRYLRLRSALKSDGSVQRLIKKLPKAATVLDVGCGVGVPVDDLIVRVGHSVWGIDLSPSLIKIAREQVPQAGYMVRDMRSLEKGEYSVEAVVCLYALFHIPRNEHQKMLQIFASFLPKGGWLLISMGDRAFEGEHEMYGVKSYSSQYGTKQNEEMVRRAGFEIVEVDLARSGGEVHQMILAKKQ